MEGRSPQPRRVFVLGATGTIGRATVRALVARGHDVACLVRRGSFDAQASARGTDPLAGASVRFGDAADADSLIRDGIRGERFDALVSCLASRSGAPDDAWAIDHRANVRAFEAFAKVGASQIVLLSAICVQRPRLAFQRAKLAAERALAGSGLAYAIVRPTAFFKSLSGQLERVRSGKPYLLFGNGGLTACKPIGDADLAAYLAEGLDDPSRRDRILPIGGPGAAITPKQQGEAMFALLGRKPRYRRVPVAAIDAVAAMLSGASRLSPALAAKAELARIGRYYATESMLVLDPATGRYDAAATPSYGSETLIDHYARALRGEAPLERVRW